MEQAEPSLGYVILAQILARENHNFVLTTNFDYLVEDSVRMFTDTKPFVAGHESLASFVSLQAERPTIIKVHRDLFLNPINDKKGTTKLKTAWESALESLVNNFHLLVIGYGGNDGSLMDFLCNEKMANRKPIYWCKRKGDALSDKVNKLLTSKDYIIDIEDFEKLMYKFNTTYEYDILENIDDENHPFILQAKARNIMLYF